MVAFLVGLRNHDTDFMLGVDACNTVLEVLLFAAAMNLGQSWNTVLTLFGGEEATNKLE